LKRIKARKSEARRYIFLLMAILTLTAALFGKTAAASSDVNASEDKAASGALVNLDEELGCIDGGVVRVKSALLYGDAVLEEKMSTGAFISTSAADAYVATTQRIVFSEEEKQGWEFKIEESAESSGASRESFSEKYAIIFNGDIETSAEPLSVGSQRSELIVLKAANLKSSTDAFSISVKEIHTPASVTIVGYLENADAEGYYDRDSAAVLNGEILKAKEGEYLKIAISGLEASEDDRLFGAPILDADGNIAGFYAGTDGHYAKGIPVNKLDQVLEVQGVETAKAAKETEGGRPIVVYSLLLAALVAVIIAASKLIRDLLQSRSRKKSMQKGDAKPRLVRVVTNESIPIKGENFFVGGHSGKCGYAVPDGMLADVCFCIVRKNSRYYVAAVSAKDSTLLNGKPIKKNELRHLKNMDNIKVGNERFLFLV